MILIRLVIMELNNGNEIVIRVEEFDPLVFILRPSLIGYLRI